MPFCEKDFGELNADSCDDGVARTKVLVVTQPKAGTYLAAEILSLAGFHNTHLHLGIDRLQAYDKYFLTEGMARPRQFDAEIGIAESRKLIRTGEIAVSHLPYSRELAKQLSGFKIVHVKRELRSAFRSWARMLLHSGRLGRDMSKLIESNGVAGFMKVKGKASISSALSIDSWKDEENVLSIKMEELLSEPDINIELILSHVKSPPGSSTTTIWKQASATQTLTRSKSYPALAWTTNDERMFEQIGGPAANMKLGYHESGISL